MIYDFDGTLAPGNMQEHDFIPQLGLKPGQFWRQAKDEAKEHRADEILAYMHVMLKEAENKKVPVTRVAFSDFGRRVVLFQGVEDWFGRIDRFGRDNGLTIQHYIVSSGLREMIEATAIAGCFARIYASSFMYDHNGVACWPALAVNYTTKTQFLFRINKGVLDVWDDSTINEYVPKEDRPVPFTRMVYIGDGSTDVPCMKLVKSQRGYAIAVYKPGSPRKAHARKLLDDDRASYIAPADYRAGKRLDLLLQAIIQKVASEVALDSASRRRTEPDVLAEEPPLHSQQSGEPSPTDDGTGDGLSDPVPLVAETAPNYSAGRNGGTEAVPVPENAKVAPPLEQGGPAGPKPTPGDACSNGPEV
jgi:hypothetical protein